MEQSKLAERLEGYRRRNNADHCYVNDDLYRLFYNKDLYIGFLGTVTMVISNYLIYRAGKTEILYGHIAGSIFMRPFRTNQRKNFILGQHVHSSLNIQILWGGTHRLALYPCPKD